jgi:dTDP-4-dehydrorhamnose reductase
VKVLLFGANGQVGWELQRSLAVLGEVVALARHGSDGLAGDLSDLDGIARTVQQVAPHVVVNAAAYTAVDRAESEPALAARINADAPAVLARAAASCGAAIVQFSTDYVFDGSGDAPWKEGDATGPLSVYGRTKLEGERGVAAANARHLILRTSWVYASRGGNFARTMLRLASEREQLRVVADQWGAPTGADLLADVTAHALRALTPAAAGTYHVAAAGETSWHGYACHVLERARAMGVALKAGPQDVEAVPTEAFPTAARRPHNSRMDTTKLRSTFGLALPPWQDGVARMLHECQPQ